MPQVNAHSCHLQGGYDPDNWQLLGASRRGRARQPRKRSLRTGPRHQDLEDLHAVSRGQRAEARRALRMDGVIRGRLLQLRARCAHEHRRSRKHERRDAHRQDPRLRLSSRRVSPRHASRSRSRPTIESLMDWGMLGYFVGDVVQERIPVLTGRYGKPDLIRYKHFGAAAASSGGVEMYHIVGVTPEAPTERAAFGSNTAVETFVYDQGGAAAHVRKPELQRARSERRLRDARLPARGARANRRGVPLAGRPQDQSELPALDLHVARQFAKLRTAPATRSSCAMPAGTCSRTPARRSVKRCRPEPRSRRSTRPSRSTTCRRSWASRRGSARPRTASTQR